jgi:pimeloyl-ACP methyl ester carboxylesterase
MPEEIQTVSPKVATYQIPYDGSTNVDLVVEDRGEGQPFLLLHGGAGPQSVAGFAKLMAASKHVRVITPTHPGFSRTIRPEQLQSPKGLAQVYVGLLDRLGVNDVTVIGNSVGGWIACEMALLDSPRVRGIVLVDAVGIEVPGHPITDISKLPPDELMRLSYHNPAPFRINPANLTEDQKAIMAGNRATLRVYGGERNLDSTLLGRIRNISLPTLVIWGESDGIVDADYARAFATAIPGAKFLLLPAAGHVPQIEAPERLLDAIWNNVEVTRRGT